MTLNLLAPGKLGRRDELSSSARARKLERGEDIQIGKVKDGIPQRADLRPSIPFLLKKGSGMTLLLTIFFKGNTLQA